MNTLEIESKVESSVEEHILNNLSRLFDPETRLKTSVEIISSVFVEVTGGLYNHEFHSNSILGLAIREEFDECLSDLEEIKDQVSMIKDELKEDIIDRYNNAEYWDSKIVHRYINDATNRNGLIVDMNRITEEIYKLVEEEN